MSEPRVEDVHVAGMETYLVRPAQPSGPGIVYLHWFDEAPNANRSQFLGEAELMADRGVVSLLPQLSFPWRTPPTDTESDLRRIREETGRLVEAVSLLKVTSGVDPGRIGIVGHDFGAMHGMTLFGEVDLAAAVLVAPTPRWSDWFLTFWPVTSDRYDYMRALSVVDPITCVDRARFPLLFQFGTKDFYIAAMTGLELARAAPEPKEVLSYETGHAMDLSEITDDRVDFLSRVLA